MTMEATPPSSPEPITFPCKSCGGPMHFDSEAQAMKCQYCGREEAIVSSDERPVEYDLELDAEADPKRKDWGIKQQAVKCENCGGVSLIPLLQTATLCAFCGSPKVLLQEDAADAIRPETMIPFQVSKSEAVNAFRAWKKKRWFVPNAFKKGQIDSALTGIYIPYWTFDSDTYSNYSAERGDYHYRNETRTRVVNGRRETYTERVRYTVWRHVSGDYGRSFDDVLIPASGQYDGELLQKLGNFRLEKLTGYLPEYLSGYVAEKYSVNRSEGWQRARNRMSSTLHNEIRQRIGGDEIRGLRVGTNYFNRTYKHILLPVWNANYKYRNKPYRYMVNGQTGLVSGLVPRSAVKITFFVLFCLAVAIPIIWWFMQNE
ncbi:hypothetical protein [Cohnella fermenti]|uniref:TFIIB-type zinc ribbon-containing protein n=1 Tax=Cohnella fermenti TaxID=2565925 RepID=A0A4V3WFL2_9BACL|nr:hypothetical protein [Cohnella fermenti]THF80742.1 hypothetical protein E6C55_09655 [Cohnella fermenti]